MLQELSIKNFAIIDDLRIGFTDGLTVLSGETGAGKSIIINAVNLLLGGRASATLIRTGAETAELEALFHIPRESAAACAMEEQGLDDLMPYRTGNLAKPRIFEVAGAINRMRTLSVI